jgi:hypothetical protein
MGMEKHQNQSQNQVTATAMAREGARAMNQRK